MSNERETSCLRDVILCAEDFSLHSLVEMTVVACPVER